MRSTLILGLAVGVSLAAQQPRPSEGTVRVDAARFTFVAFPRDVQLARALLTGALARDTFPGLPRPTARVTVWIAPDADRFRAWTGSSAPEWGAAIAFPESHRIVMQGSNANSSAGDPAVTLRHELAHLALHEGIGDVATRWFDEGYAAYAAGEWGRDDVLETNLALVLRGMPRLDALDGWFTGGASRAQQGYALAHRAVAEMAAMDGERGLSLFLGYWRESGSLDQALRRAYGLTESTFEARWKSATRRRYGVLALFADLSAGVLALLLVAGPLWMIRRQRDRARLAALLAAEEAQDRRERQGMLAALLGEQQPADSGPDAAEGRGTPRLDDDRIN